MKFIPTLSLMALPVVFLALTACQKSEPADKTEVQKVENVNATAKAVPVPPPAPAPTIAPGTWIGTMADGSDAATLTIDAGNRATVVQQDSPTTGSYQLSGAQNLVVFTFTPDGGQGKSYSSQIQWLDENTITMTSFVDATVAQPVAVSSTPIAPAAQAVPAQPQQAPFTGNVPPPAGYASASSTPAQASAPAMDNVISTITFRRQVLAPAPSAIGVSQ